MNTIKELEQIRELVIDARFSVAGGGTLNALIRQKILETLSTVSSRLATVNQYLMDVECNNV